MPSLTEMFGIMPWHFGGDHILSYREQSAYLSVYEDRAREARRAQLDRARASRRS